MFSAATKTDNVSSAANYIEDVFSTYLYTGNNTSRTITNNIDLTTYGGLVWTKERSGGAAAGATNHALVDTVRGAIKNLRSNTTGAEFDSATGVTAFNNNGYSIGAGGPTYNESSGNYASWTFRKQPKFFDVVTYTGNDTTQNISHNLGSVPGCVIVKCSNAAASWFVWHRGQSAGFYSILNTTAAQTNGSSVNTFGNNTTYVDPTSTQFTVGSNGNINQSGNTYVAYLFAHNAGGFGASGTDNVISCGSFTTNGSGAATVTLGYEPQFVLFKASGAVDNWIVLDNMRNWSNNGSTGSAAYLYPNLAQAEGTAAFGYPTATGFQVSNQANSVGYIYIAICRGPMRTPTSGASVFSPLTRTGTGAVASVTGVGFTPDLLWSKSRNTGNAVGLHDRLRGSTRELLSNSTAIEFNDASSVTSINMDGYSFGTDASGSGTVNLNTANYIYWNFKRAPGFFDEVCYTGTGAAANVSHNLGVVPELMIVKTRSTVDFWYVYHSAVGNTKYLQLQATSAPATSSVVWNNTTPTSSVFSTGIATSGSGVTHVAYLFATLAGVSKVGSYTGTAALQTINCGFAAGARFVLVKATSTTGDWYVWDSARGISSSTDPYLLLNSTAAEVTTTNWVDTDSTGFKLTAAVGNLVNTNGTSYIFLAIS